VLRRSATNRQGNVREFHIVWRVVTLYATHTSEINIFNKLNFRIIIIIIIQHLYSAIMSYADTEALKWHDIAFLC